MKRRHTRRKTNSSPKSANHRFYSKLKLWASRRTSSKKRHSPQTRWQKSFSMESLEDRRLMAVLSGGSADLGNADLISLPANVSVLSTDVDNGGLESLDLTAATAIVMDDAGNAVADLGPDTERAMASTTKIMTVMFTIERSLSGEFSLDDIVKVGSYAKDAGGSGFNDFQTGQEFVLEDLLYFVMLRSDNSAAQTVAEYVALNTDLGRSYIEDATAEYNAANDTNIDANSILNADASFDEASGIILNTVFVKLMNLRAQQMGLTHTQYINPHGRDPNKHPEQGFGDGPNDGHYSSARDLAELSRHAMDYEKFAEIAGETFWSASSTLPDSSSRVYSASTLVGIMPNYASHYPGATGVKGGGTGAAGSVLVSQATILGRTLNAAVMDSDNSSTRTVDTHKILNYGFEEAFGFIVDSDAHIVETRTSSYDVAAQTLSINGTEEDDIISIYRFANDMWITVNGVSEYLPIADIHQLVVQAGGGDDTIIISGMPEEIAGGAFVFAGAGSDTVRLGTGVGLGIFDAPVTVIGGGGVNDQVILRDDGTDSGQRYALAGDQFQREDETILVYQDIDTLSVNGSGYADTLEVIGHETGHDDLTILAERLVLNNQRVQFNSIENITSKLGDGTSTVVIEAFPEAGLRFFGGEDADLFVLNAAGNSTRVFNVEGGNGEDELKINRDAAEDLMLVDEKVLIINNRTYRFEEVETLEVNLGEGTSTTVVGRFPEVDSFIVHGGTADDVFSIIPSELYPLGADPNDQPQGTVSFHGRGGLNSLHGAERENAWKMTDATSGNLNGDIMFSNMAQLVGSSERDSLEGADIDNVWSIFGSDSGELNGAQFSGMESLTGGARGDTFHFAADANFTGDINGGAGNRDWLKYDDYGRAVNVDLLKDTATAVGGAVVGIEMVSGSEHDDFIRGNENSHFYSGQDGNDILIDLANNGTLLGGNGRDIMVAGEGADRADGGNGDDLFIGGSTVWDTDDHADRYFDSIRDAWSRTDQTFEERTERLRNGVLAAIPSGILGYSKQRVALDAESVLSDDTRDRLVDPAGHDWYFSTLSETEDLDNRYLVEDLRLAYWKANYGRRGAPARRGDFDRNGFVNGLDFLKWQREARS